jgi:hypothetical protein
LLVSGIEIAPGLRQLSRLALLGDAQQPLDAMNSAFPSPQPARKPKIWPMLLEAPASALNTTMRTSPASSVRLAPILVLTQPVISMATAGERDRPDRFWLPERIGWPLMRPLT